MFGSGSELRQDIVVFTTITEKNDKVEEDDAEDLDSAPYDKKLKDDDHNEH
jgi:hypothetical protein